MKRRIKDLIGFSIGATDGEIGVVKDFYFDDETWTIRYLIVETGNWFAGHKVLISPEAVLNPDWEHGVFNVNITQEQIKNSPPIDTEKPVSRQQEMWLYEHYLWRGYLGSGIWAGGMGTAGLVTPDPVYAEQAIKHKDEKMPLKENNDDPHLRSTGKVAGYNIKAADGKVGDVHDFIIDETTWKIDFLLVDTGHWLPGKKVLISPKLIENIDWKLSAVTVKAPVNQVKNSPEYNPEKGISESYEASLQHHYEESFPG